MKKSTLYRLCFASLAFMLFTAQRCAEVTELKAPSGVTAGTPFEVKTRVKNLMTDPQSFGVKVFLSYDHLWNVEDKLLGTVPVNNLNPYAFSENTLQLNIESSRRTGRYYLIAQASDGEMYKEVFVTGTPNNGVDLVPTHLYTWGGNKPGEEYFYAYTLQNVGTTTGNACKVRAYISLDQYVDATDIQVGEQLVTNLFIGNSRREFNGAFHIPANLAEGGYRLIIAADAANQLTETVEDNNTVSAGFSVSYDSAPESPAGVRAEQPDRDEAPGCAIYPNPSSGTTHLSLSLPQPAAVRVMLYDQHGRLLREIPEKTLDAGQYGYPIDLSEAPNGMYLATVLINGKPAMTQKVAVKH